MPKEPEPQWQDEDMGFGPEGEERNRVAHGGCWLFRCKIKILT